MFAANTVHTASFALALALTAGSASAGRLVDAYVFNTTTGAVTYNGGSTSSFNGVPIVNRGVSVGIRTWSIQGDMVLPPAATVVFTGSNLAKVLVGGNMIVPTDGLIDASASGDSPAVPGPGGGLGRIGGTGGSPGGTGGGGGSGNSTNGSNGQDASGSNGGAGGIIGRPGGAGGDGDTGAGAAGADGLARSSGSTGSAGDTGNAGGDGLVGINNGAAASVGGAGGNTGGGGLGAAPGAGAGGGGVGGTGVGGNGGNGTSGSAGAIGATGGAGSIGSPGNNGLVFIPAPAQVAILNAANGGSGGGGGGSGGGGGGGSSGGGGGGGGSGAGFLITWGGGGGGGGAGGTGGRGGTGGAGGAGGSGGGGGGGLQFVVQGVLQISGHIAAEGGNGGAASSGFAGGAGALGGTRGVGGNGAASSAGDGGDGGNGGGGGAGGPGGAGAFGGGGGGGAGGTVFLTATAFTGTGAVLLTGGSGASTVAPAGRILLSDARDGTASVNRSPTPSSSAVTLDFIPTAVNPYFGSATTPNIVATSASAAPIEGGPGPFGLLPAGIADAELTTAIANAPPRARGVVVRYPYGPSGFSNGYNISSTSGGNTFDMFLLVNLTGVTQACSFNGVATSRFPFTRRAEFGGAGTRESVTVPAGRAWACLGTEELDVVVPVTVGPYSASLTLPDAVAPAVVRYIIEPCGPADLGQQGGVEGADGLLDNNDFVVFVDLFFGSDARADMGSQGGVPGPDGALNNNDFIVFIDRFFAGC